MRDEKEWAEEMESDRKDHELELDADDPGWREKFKPGTFGCHELLDRTSVVQALVDDLVTHPACVANPEWFALATRANGALIDLYQTVGASHLPEVDDRSTTEG